MSDGSQVLAERPAAAWFGPACVLAGGVCIGLAPIGLRYGLDALGPFAIAFWRYVFAVPMLFALLMFTARRLPVVPDRFIVIAGTCFALDIALWHWGLTFTSVANATFIVNLGNIGAGLTAWIFLAHRPSGTWAVAACVALVGAAILSLGGDAASATDWRGDLLALAAAVLVSGYVVAAAVARRNVPAIDAIFWLTVVEVFVAGGTVLAAGEAFLPPSLNGFAAPLFLAIVAQLGGQGFIVFGLGRTSPAIAGVLILIQPVVAAFVSWQLFGEALTGLQIGGAVLILAGVFLAQRRG